MFRVSKQAPCFTAIEENIGDKGLVDLEADGVASLNYLPEYQLCSE